MKTLIICIILVTSSFTIGLRGFNQRANSVSQYKADQALGAPAGGIFAQVYALLNSKGAYADVYELLDKMKGELVAEQDGQRKIYIDQKKDCNDEISLRGGEILEAENANKAAEKAFNGCTAALTGAGLALEVTEETLRNK